MLRSTLLVGKSRSFTHNAAEKLRRYALWFA